MLASLILNHINGIAPREHGIVITFDIWETIHFFLVRADN
jgi:hypothetical protein